MHAAANAHHALGLRRGAARPAADDLARALDRFLFGASQWVHEGALRARLHLAHEADAGPLTLSPVQCQRLTDRIAPSTHIEVHRLAHNWRSRLALLDAQRWLDLGMTLSVLPFCGQAQRSMDGSFRRALRDRFGADAAALLDAQAGKGPALTCLLGPGAWKNPPAVAAAGVSAALLALGDWGSVVLDRFTLQFDPQVLKTAPSVAGLDDTWLEIACKLTLQDHPWLWS